jgi:hypothetical protein
MCICARLQGTLPKVLADLSDYDDEKCGTGWWVLCVQHMPAAAVMTFSRDRHCQVARQCTGAGVVTLHLVVQTKHGIAANDVVVLWASPPCTAYSPLGRLRRKGGYTDCWRLREPIP